MKADLISFTQSCIFRAQLPRPMRNKVREGSYEITGKSHPASSWWEKSSVRIKSLEGWAQTGLWGRCYVLVSYQGWVEGTALFWVLGEAASNSCSPPKFSWPPEVWKRLYSLTVGVLEWEAPEICRQGDTEAVFAAALASCHTVSGAEHAVGSLLGDQGPCHFIFLLYDQHTHVYTDSCAKRVTGEWMACLPRHLKYSHWDSKYQ